MAATDAPLRQPWIVFLGGALVEALLLVQAHFASPQLEHALMELAALAGIFVSALAAAMLYRQMLNRRQAEARAEAMRDELERLAMVARQSHNVVVITDVARRITWVNAAFERLTGYTAAESIGRSPGALLQCPGTDAAVVLRMREAFAAGRGFTGEVLNRSREGRDYWLSLDVQPLHDAAGRLSGFVAIEMDVTERRAAADALRASQAFLHTIGRIAGVAGWSIALADGSLHWSDEACALLDMAPGHQPGVADCVALVQADARPALQALIDEGLGERNSWDLVLPVTSLGGRPLWLRLVAELEYADAGPVRLVGALQDITELVAARQAAERASQAKSEFIATISHELRTPLQSVIGFSELGVHFAQQQAQFHAMFSDILAGGRRMLRLVNTLLDMAKVDAGSATMALEPGCLRHAVDGVLAELQPLAAPRRIDLVLAPVPARLPARIDLFRIQQVLRNLLANALRFAPEGSRIEITGADFGPVGVRLLVRDHGPGIPEDELESIFDAFVQSSRTRDGAGGTGLGLSISRRIVAGHGGRLEASNAPGGGACFSLWLPALPPEALPTPSAAPHAADTATAALP